MKTIKYNTTDVYEKISKWWEAHNFPVLDIDFIPKYCYITSKDDVELYAVFLYRTDSHLAWLSFPVSNPDLSKDFKEGGLEKLFSDTVDYAKQEGYKYIFTTSPLPIIQKALISSGFVLGDEQVNHYIKKL